MNPIFIILILIGLLKLYTTIKQIMANQKCVSNETISNYYKGKATQAERNHLIGHIAGCKKCQELFHNYDPRNDVEQPLIDDSSSN